MKPVIGLFHELASVSLNRDTDKKNHYSVSDDSMATINMYIPIEALIMFFMYYEFTCLQLRESERDVQLVMNMIII